MQPVKTSDKTKPGIKHRALLSGIQSLLIKLLVVAGLSVLSSICYSKTLIYVANTDSQDIAVFQLNKKSGKSNLLQKIPVGGAVMPMVLSPAIVGQHSESSDKILSHKRLLYAAIRSEPYRLMVLAINPHDGRLSITSSISLVDSMGNIALDREGRYLLAASYGGNKISAHRLNGSGIPDVAAQVLAAGAHPHQITVDEHNKFIYVSLLGDDRLDYYRFHPADKTGDILDPENKQALMLAAGSGPRHFAFSKTHNIIYLLNELNARIHVLTSDLKTGQLALVETHALLSNSIKPWAADIHLTPDGKFLYATERTTHRIFGFAIDQKTGQLSAIADWKTEEQPRAFGISPQGDYLVVAGQKSNHISIYRIAPDSGRLERVDRQASGENPSWVEIMELPGNE